MTTLTPEADSDLRLRARLAARLHDPPEKALVLMRTREGHEGGTVRALLHELFPEGLPPAIEAAVTRADHWASAADRMAFPKREADGRHPSWQQVRFAEQPVLIHPLTGQAHDLSRHGSLADDIAAAQAQALGTDHLRSYVVQGDLRQTALALWRFGPDLHGELSELWRLLPADSRVPDHTIHDHVDLTAALAGCFAVPDDGGAALLVVTLGPVQDFIAAARSVSDLWAGSHLLSHLAWTAMRVVCEACGPEAIVFPRLRGVPAVDLWLREQGLPEAWFESCDWRSSASDANPLFAAALPNRFTALVPAARAPELARRIGDAVRKEALELAKAAYCKLLEAAGTADDPALHGYRQIERQLDGFPELHWTSVPWSLAMGAEREGRVTADDAALTAALRPFWAQGRPEGFLGSAVWQALKGEMKLDEGWFYTPNPGALYPALHELADRTLAAAKTVRRFEATSEEGWRCTLTGEAEWVTTDAAQLQLPPGQRKDTIWAKAAGRFGIRAGEHLSALPMLKRLWPTLFVERIQTYVRSGELARYVVSTHTMALAPAIEAALNAAKTLPDDMRGERAALPARLAARVAKAQQPAWAQLPGWLDAQTEAGEGAGERARARLAKLLGAKPETYYGLLLMDGDDMGAWLGASGGKTPKVAASFHPQLRDKLDRRFGVDPKFLDYAEARRAPNPAWHMAISQALNHFALELAPHVVEREHLGKLIYAGGDDVLAMLAARDLLPAAAMLRAVYGGSDPAACGARDFEHGTLERSGNGWARFDGRVLRLMGDAATASAGLVIAHHQAPLGAVLRALREAERRAKDLPGKNAWSLALLKRGGGAIHVTAHWGAPLTLFEDLRAFLASDDVSRRAAYHVADWLHAVPGDDAALAQSLLGYQMARQARGAAKRKAEELAARLVALSFDASQRPDKVQPLPWLANFMLAAEFFARATRHDTPIQDKEGALV
jgi:CRISPR-associated protein Cmr2